MTRKRTTTECVGKESWHVSPRLRAAYQPPADDPRHAIAPPRGVFDEPASARRARVEPTPRETRARGARLARNITRGFSNDRDMALGRPGFSRSRVIAGGWNARDARSESPSTYLDVPHVPGGPRARRAMRPARRPNENRPGSQLLSLANEESLVNARGSAKSPLAQIFDISNTFILYSHMYSRADVLIPISAASCPTTRTAQLFRSFAAPRSTRSFAPFGAAVGSGRPV